MKKKNARKGKKKIIIVFHGFIIQALSSMQNDLKR